VNKAMTLESPRVKHNEREHRFGTSKLDVAAPATGWSEPVSGRELQPLKATAFRGAVSHQLSNRLVGNWHVRVFSRKFQRQQRVRVFLP
jgi:hypothetical protein